MQNGREVGVKDGGRQGIKDHEGQFAHLAIFILELVDDDGEGGRDAGGRQGKDDGLGLEEKKGREREEDICEKRLQL